MCGICGMLLRGQPVEPAALERMRDAMVHRGPDDCGLFLDGSAGLGHRRLSIIDLSAAGRQPLSGEDGQVVLVFNGEVYNYLELAAELKARGHRFASQTDSEVVVHAYEEWGSACLERFIGMFAFALLDRRARRLLLARDPMGVKPLYYHAGAEQFLFASELKALARAEPACREPSRAALYDFLTLERFDHDDSTSFERVRQVQPGRYLEVPLDGWAHLRQVRYWDPSPERARQRYDYGAPVEAFRDLFDHSVALQLRSDVPVGVLLSGGLDSSAILATAAPRYPGRLHAFSVTFADAGFDEAPFAQAMARAHDAVHESITPASQTLRTDLRDFVRAQEVPTNGPGPFSEWCVARLAARRVKVVLSGQGPDEMLGGYFRYFEPYVHARLRDRRLGGLARWRRLAREVGDIRRLTGRSAASYAVAALAGGGDGLRRRFKRARAGALLSGDLRACAGQVAVGEPGGWPGDTALDRALAESLTGWGIARLLHYGDRNTMAVSLEGRVPYLDHRLVEFSLGLPYDMKIRGAVTKWILREAMKDRLPPGIVERRDKKGFPTPVGRWLRESEEFVRDLLTPRSLRERGLLRPAGVERLLRDHFAGRRDRGWELWRLLNLELWFQELVDAGPATGGPARSR